MLDKLKINYGRLNIVILAIGLVFSVYSFYFFVNNKVYLIGADQYYYMSLSDSILDYGKMDNITSIPSKPIKSPQNGIVFIHILLTVLGVTHRQAQLIIVYFNYFIYLSGIYPLFMISKYYGIRKIITTVILMAVYLGPWHIYRINLLAINDGIFNASILWLSFILIKIFDSKNSLILSSLKNGRIKEIMVLVILTIISMQFRLNTALILGSAIISGIALKNLKVSLITLIIALVMLLILFGIIYYFSGVPTFRVAPNFRRLFEIPTLYNIKMILWKILPRLVSGFSPLSNPLLSIGFSIFPLSMFYSLYRGYIERNFSKIFVALICITALWFTFRFKNARVIFYTFPFIYLLILGDKKTKIIGYALVLVVFLQSFQTFFEGFNRGPDSNLFLHIYENKISLSDKNSLLITDEAPHAYYFLGTRSFRSELNTDGSVIINPELTWALMEKKLNIFVLGNNRYIKSVNSQIAEKARANDYNLEFNQITPKLKQFKGWALVQLTLN